MLFPGRDIIRLTDELAVHPYYRLALGGMQWFSWPVTAVTFTTSSLVPLDGIGEPLLIVTQRSHRLALGPTGHPAQLDASAKAFAQMSAM